MPQKESDQDLDAKYFDAYKKSNKANLSKDTHSVTQSGSRAGSTETESGQQKVRTASGFSKIDSILKPSSSKQGEGFASGKIILDEDERTSLSSTTEKCSLNSHILMPPSDSTRRRDSIR